jgi:hypothetical protein
LKQQHAKARAVANKKSSKSKTSRGSGSKGMSNAEKMASALQLKLESSDEQIASIKEALSDQAAAPIGGSPLSQRQ